MNHYLTVSENPSVKVPRDRMPAARATVTLTVMLFLSAGLQADESGFGALEVETTVETNFERLSNRDLDDGTRDDLSILKPELVFEIGYGFNERSRAFTELELERRLIVSRGRDRSRESNRTELSLKQLYLDLGNLAEGLFLRVGRQEFEDSREWLYDEDLDGMRVFYRREALSFELSVSRERQFTENLLENDREEDQVNNYILFGNYELSEDHRVGAHALIRDDRSDGSENPIFYTLSAFGTVSSTLDYWLELAHVRGRDGSDRLRGFGFDIGSTYRLETGWQPSLTLGYAFGSGDSGSESNVDRRFRQIGLEDNSHRFNGVEEFRYYGEALDPELSNLSILTAGLGIRPSRRSSIDLVYHQYHQDVAASERVEGARIRARANGESRKIGQAIDLILGYHEIPDLRLRAKLGYFMPGDAFGHSAGDAHSIEIGIEYNY